MFSPASVGANCTFIVNTRCLEQKNNCCDSKIIKITIRNAHTSLGERGAVTPAGIAKENHRLNTPRPVATSVLAHPVRRKITVATRQRRYRSRSPCPRKASAQSDPRRRLKAPTINSSYVAVYVFWLIKRESFIHQGCQGDYWKCAEYNSVNCFDLLYWWKGEL